MRARIAELAPHVAMPTFTPGRPPMPEAVAIAPSLIHSDQRPPGS
jgi:hypothetical protein